LFNPQSKFMKNYYYKLLIKVINYSFIGMFCQLFLAGLCIANDADAQKAKSIEEVSIEAKYIGASLAEIFKNIESQTDFVFTYDKKDSFLKERYTNDRGRTIVADLFRDISLKNHLIFQQINNNISVRESCRKMKFHLIQLLLLLILQVQLLLVKENLCRELIFL
jgi:hypothetical protein